MEEVVEVYRSENAFGSIEIRLADQLPPAEMDPGRIRQLLHNLIKNAREATEGRKGARIVISTHLVKQAPQPFAELHVEDNGPGVPEEILERVFEPYVTTKPKGTGLGLAIVKKIVEEHNGSIGIENLPQGGTRITVSFPAVLDERRRQRRVQKEVMQHRVNASPK